MTRAHWSLLRRFLGDERSLVDGRRDELMTGYLAALDAVAKKMSAIVRANKRRQVKRA